jgi:DNA-binding MarR family transcriptional regulator
LEKKGLVARLPSQNDRRVTNVALTASGLKLVDSSPNVLHNQFTTKINNLPPETREMIGKSLSTIISVLSISDIDASPILTLDDPIQPEPK